MTNDKKRKVLYVASTASHLKRFHMPYIEALRADAEVYLMASGDAKFLNFDLPFEKNMFSVANVKSIGKIRKILKYNRFDAVILNTSLAAFLVRAAMIGMRRRPYVHNIVHGYLFDEPITSKKERILHLCERLMRRKTDAISVMNEADLLIAKRNKFCRSEVNFLYGMGVTMTAEGSVDADLRAQYAKEGELLCTFVGELSGRKNQSFLIDAVKMLRERGIPAKLMLLGDGAERDALAEQIGANGLDEHVFLLGNREPVSPFLAVSDLYVSASRIEGLPFNIMEAMAYGLPIVASDAKGQTDLLSDKPASIYPRGDLDAFCNAVESVWKTGRFGMRSVEYPALERYRLDAVLQENLEIIRKGWC